MKKEIFLIIAVGLILASCDTGVKCDDFWVKDRIYQIADKEYNGLDMTPKGGWNFQLADIKTQSYDKNTRTSTCSGTLTSGTEKGFGKALVYTIENLDTIWKYKGEFAEYNLTVVSGMTK